jgi:hypothetical protein
MKVGPSGSGLSAPTAGGDRPCNCNPNHHKQCSSHIVRVRLGRNAPLDSFVMPIAISLPALLQYF